MNAHQRVRERFMNILEQQNETFMKVHEFMNLFCSWNLTLFMNMGCLWTVMKQSQFMNDNELNKFIN